MNEISEKNSSTGFLGLFRLCNPGYEFLQKNELLHSQNWFSITIKEKNRKKKLKPFSLKSICWPNSISRQTTFLAQYKKQNKTYIHTSTTLKRKNVMAHFMDRLQPCRGYRVTTRLQSHYEVVYFLPLSSREFILLIWSTTKGWKTKWPWSHPLVLNPRTLD